MEIDLSTISIATVFFAGLISFLSPCVLPLVPAYVSYIANQSYDDIKKSRTFRESYAIFLLAVFFVLGFSTVFIALGASASTLGQLLLKYRYETNIIGGTIIIIFGLFMMGILKFTQLNKDVRFSSQLKRGNPISAYILGLAFAFGWTPCIGPILGAILTVSAVSPVMSQSIALLAIYSIGLGVPFLFAALFTSTIIRHVKIMSRVGQIFNKAAGMIMVILGVAMITGYLSKFAFWLLKTFPTFSAVG
ncbi:cytochrome c biogenesis CcdA family protein [Pseudomonadota bacterium]